MIFRPSPRITSRTPASLVSQSPATRSRKLVFVARDILSEQGYAAICNSRAWPPVDIVAWKKGEGVLLIVVRRTRSPGVNAADAARRLASDIGLLRSMEKPDRARIMLWLFHYSSGWKKYEVFAGGIMDTEG